MKAITKNFVFCLALLMVLLLVTGCPEKSTTRALTPTTCLSDLIRITPTATKGGNVNNWRVTVSITVTCAGPPPTPLANSEIKITYLGDNYIYSTDGTGTYSRNFGPATGDPTGNRVTVSVMGSDGSEASVTTMVQ